MTTLRDLKEGYEEKLGRELTTREFKDIYDEVYSKCYNYVNKNSSPLHIRSEWHAIYCDEADYDSDVILMFRMEWNCEHGKGFYTIEYDEIEEIFDPYVDFTELFVKYFEEITAQMV